MRRYCLFDTELGAFGIAWGEAGLARLQLPERDRARTEQRLRARFAKLESFIADLDFDANLKYMNSYHIQNFATAVLCSNMPKALILAKDDRRWAVPRITGLKVQVGGGASLSPLATGRRPGGDRTLGDQLW
jgi:hypothetical protein